MLASRLWIDSDVRGVQYECLMNFATIPQALEELKRGKMIIVVDDPDRENEGDLVVAAECCTPEIMNFMIK